MQTARDPVPSAPEPFSPANRLRAIITDTDNQNSNMVSAALWMIVLTIALFFVPTLNGLIGGFIGGFKAGSVRDAFIAAALPALVIGAALWVLFALLGVPIFGVLAGPGAAIIIAMSEIGLFLGAAIGGYSAQRSRSTD